MVEKEQEFSPRAGAGWSHQFGITQESGVVGPSTTDRGEKTS